MFVSPIVITTISIQVSLFKERSDKKCRWQLILTLQLRYMKFFHGRITRINGFLRRTKKKENSSAGIQTHLPHYHHTISIRATVTFGGRRRVR